MFEILIFILYLLLLRQDGNCRTVEADKVETFGLYHYYNQNASYITIKIQGRDIIAFTWNLNFVVNIILVLSTAFSRIHSYSL